MTSKSKQKILYGAGDYGRKAFNHYGIEQVYAFADINKSGTEYLGKPILHPSELVTLGGKYEIIVCVKEYDSVVDYLKSIDVSGFLIFFPSSAQALPELTLLNKRLEDLRNQITHYELQRGRDA